MKQLDQQNVRLVISGLIRSSQWSDAPVTLNHKVNNTHVHVVSLPLPSKPEHSNAHITTYMAARNRYGTSLDESFHKNLYGSL